MWWQCWLRQLTRYKPGEVSLEKDVVMPYVANVDHCDADCLATSLPLRKTLLFFRGRTDRHGVQKSILFHVRIICIECKLKTSLKSSSSFSWQEHTTHTCPMKEYSTHLFLTRSPIFNSCSSRNQFYSLNHSFLKCNHIRHSILKWCNGSST